MYFETTIVAKVTASGNAGVGILRVSGTKVLEVSKMILRKRLKARYADYVPFYDRNGNKLDYGIAIYFPKPKSFTGEDIIEFHCHGGEILLKLLISQILSIEGIRVANPGEFSKRAFLNNKIDLVQAESIIDLINAKTEKAARSAINSLDGTFSRKIQKILNYLIDLRSSIELSIDFSEEENPLLSNFEKKQKLNKIISCLEHIYSLSYHGRMVRCMPKVVLIGEPNVGKSSLFNALSGYQRAIVTNVPGTTRDVLREEIDIDGLSIRLIDTAGLRKNSSNPIESIGINLALKEIEKADHILYLLDSSKSFNVEFRKSFFKFINKKDFKNSSITFIKNKIDLTNEISGLKNNQDYALICISVLKNEGIDFLKKYLKHKFNSTMNSEENLFLARSRHLKSLKNAKKYLYQALENLSSTFTYSNELVSEDLRLAQISLGEILGGYTSNDLLSEIFSKFCIGK